MTSPSPTLDRATRTASPAVIAHRGGLLETPENTLLAFRHARLSGATGIELDARMCRDGRAVVFHDEDTERLEPHNPRNIVTLPLDVVMELDVGGLAGADYRGEFIPPLRLALSRYGRDTLVLIDLKRDTTYSARQLVATVLDDIAAARVDYARVNERAGNDGSHERERDCVCQPGAMIGSGDPDVLAACIDLAPDIPRFAMLRTRPLPHCDELTPPEELLRFAPSVVAIERALVTRERVEAAQRRGYWVWAYPARTAAEIDSMLDAGCDGLITDIPAAAQGKLRADAD